jgi:4-hydroxy-tetrahydrodipicolinate synthase
MNRFAGALTALITPFRNGEVDLNALRELTETQIGSGINGIVPCGTTGEAVNLNDTEYTQVIRTVVKTAKGRVPVIAGAGTASTKRTLELCHAAKAAGADAVLVVAPYYVRPTQEGLFEHFKAVGEGASLPVILYNIPSRTGTDVALSTLERLAAVSQIVGIKESTGNVLRSQAIAATLGDRFTILSGDDALALAVLAVGGHGVISVTSNLAPKAVSEMVRLFGVKDLPSARALHQRLLKLHEVMFVETNPAPVKAALAMRGRIAAEIRLPLVWPTEASLEKIRIALRENEALL